MPPQRRPCGRGDGLAVLGTGFADMDLGIDEPRHGNEPVAGLAQGALGRALVQGAGSGLAILPSMLDLEPVS